MNKCGFRLCIPGDCAANKVTKLHINPDMANPDYRKLPYDYDFI